jgi:PadR family transcriptional regulator, regulatory protein AphA
VASATPATYGLLGMLATRSWTGYELTQQVRRSLRFVWPTSEGHLYREQKKLVALGWATVVDEPVGRRTRQRYAITGAGRRALRAWLATDPEEPHLQVEGVLRAFYGNHAGPQELASSMRATAASAREMLSELRGFVDEYLDGGGPVELLERGVGGPGGRREFHGRELYPERLHTVALAIDVTTRLLETVDDFFTTTAEEVADWPSTDDPVLTPATRARLERIRARGGPS